MVWKAAVSHKGDICYVSKLTVMQGVGKTLAPHLSHASSYLVLTTAPSSLLLQVRKLRLKMTDLDSYSLRILEVASCESSGNPKKANVDSV